MKLIATITEENFNRQPTPEKWNEYRVRPGARAVLFDSMSRVAIMHVSNHNYYKLPGGGVDEGEDTEAGLRRELLEEVGASSVEIISEIGQVYDYRDNWGLKSEHSCFVAKLSGELVEPQRTHGEIEAGYQTLWVKDLEEAIALVESGSPTDYGQDFEKERELIFLKELKNQLEEKID